MNIFMGILMGLSFTILMSIWVLERQLESLISLQRDIADNTRELVTELSKLRRDR